MNLIMKIMHVSIVQINASPGPNADQVSKDFFISRFVHDNENHIDILDTREQLSDRWEEILRIERQNLEEQLDVFGGGVTDLLMELIFSPIEDEISVPRRDIESLPNSWKYTGTNNGTEFSTVLIRLPGNSRPYGSYIESGPTGRIVRRRGEDREAMWMLASNSKEEVEYFIDHLMSQIRGIEEMISDFVVLDNFKQGPDIVRDYFDGLATGGDYVTDWEVTESNDEFEQEVFEVVNDLTGVCLPNVSVQSSVGESPEYDVVALPIGPRSQKYAIEAKNYDRDTVNEDVIEFDNLRNALITHPKEEAERVDLSLITVVKGLADDQYNNLKRHAEPSNVILLNETNYERELEDVLIRQSIHALKRRMEYQRYL